MGEWSGEVKGNWNEEIDKGENTAGTEEVIPPQPRLPQRTTQWLMNPSESPRKEESA